MEQFGLDGNVKALTSNGDFDEEADEDWELEEAGSAEATAFRGAAARLSFLGQDSPETQYPAKEISRDMAKPKTGSWKRLKKVIRFVAGREAVVRRYPWQDGVAEIDVYTDSDWGGRVGSRKSTSGGVAMLGKHPLKTWSSTQGAIALSSAEAEFYAMIEAMIRAKGLKALASELGVQAGTGVINLHTDSTAAKSFVSRRGLGKMRHIEIKELWLQREVGDGSVRVVKVLGEENLADLMTNILKLVDIRKHLKAMNMEIEWVGGWVCEQAPKKIVVAPPLQ